MQTILLVINDAPYGTEKAYNALRMAMTLQKEHATETVVRIFLLADAVFCALPHQNTPAGSPNIERMLRSVLAHGGEVKTCGGCAQARGIDALPFIEGIQPGTMKEFAQWTVESDKVISF